MLHRSHRRDTDAISAVQKNNEQWWTKNTMSYDWKEVIGKQKGCIDWFDEVDRRFVLSSRLFAHDKRPFDKLIPFDQLVGKRVLEIGCGMGLHTELMVCAGAEVIAIDISATSVEMTKKRLELKGLTAEVVKMDAEAMAFTDDQFDFIWSWGVIHHSSRTGRVVREMARVLKPEGEGRIMVYNLEGMPAYITIMLHYSWRFWVGSSLDEILWKNTDGFMARYYSRDMLGDFLRTFFDKVEVSVLGQDADAVPLPRYLRRIILPIFSVKRLQELVRHRGAFLFARFGCPN